MNCEDIKPDGQPNGRRLYHADELRKGAPAWPYYGGTPTTDRIFAQITPTLEGLDRALEREFFVRAELAQLAPVQDEPWPAYRAYVRATFGCEPPECYAIQRHWPSTAPASWQSMAIGLSGKLLYGWLYDSSSIFRGFDHGYYDSSSIFRGFDHGYSYYAFDFAGVSSLPLSLHIELERLVRVYMTFDSRAPRHDESWPSYQARIREIVPRQRIPGVFWPEGSWTWFGRKEAPTPRWRSTGLRVDVDGVSVEVYAWILG